MHRPLGRRACEEPGQAREAEPGRPRRCFAAVAAQESSPPQLVFGLGRTSRHAEPPCGKAWGRTGNGFTVPQRFFSWTTAHDPLHGPAMQTDPVRALEAVQQRGDRQRRVVGALRSYHHQDLDVVGQAVDQCDGARGVWEDGVPALERQVGGDEQGAVLVAAADELEEQVGGAGVGGEVAYLIDKMLSDR